MKKLVLVLAVSIAACNQTSTANAPDSPEVAASRTRAEGVTIIRDDWGVPHIYGKTDATVFGLSMPKPKTTSPRRDQFITRRAAGRSGREGDLSRLRMRLSRSGD